MKYLSRGLVASAAGLLVLVGLAAPASAVPADCEVRVGDVTRPEGNADGTVMVTITTNDHADCAGVVLRVFTDDDTAVAPGDYTAVDTTVTLQSGTTTYPVPIPVEGDTVFEADEKFLVFIEDRDDEGITITDDDAVVTLTNDDAGIGAGGAITLNPSSGDPGTTITVTGTKCEGAETVDVFLGASSGQSGSVVASKENVPVNADNSFSTTLTVPEGSDPEATYTVTADCNGDVYDFASFDVTGPTGDNGYRMVAADGGIFTFGDREFHGSTGDLKLNKPIVGGATDVSDYEGYWIVASDGGIFTFSAGFYGSLGDKALTSPAVEIEPTPTGKGYWIVQADGTVTPFGDATFLGDFRGKALNKPVIGMAVTPSGKGYWLVAEDGGIFNFGDADFFGSMGDQKLNAPIIDLAPAVDNNGYYLLGRDGGVFTFGSADFKGSTGAMTLNAPVVAMLVAPNGAGYWLAATDGGIFTFGSVGFLGSMGGTKLNSPVLDLIN